MTKEYLKMLLFQIGYLSDNFALPFSKFYRSYKYWLLTQFEKGFILNGRLFVNMKWSLPWAWDIDGVLDWTNTKRFNKNNLIIYYTNYTKIPPFRYKYNVVFAIVLRYWWCPGFCFPIREVCRKSKWKFKMAFAMKGGEGGLEGVSFAIKLFWKMIFLKTI